MTLAHDHQASRPSTGEPVEVRIVVGIGALIAGACVGALIVATPIAIAALVTMNADTLGFALIALLGGFIAWLLGSLVVTPLWIVMHCLGWTKPLHAAIAGAAAPGVIGALAFQSIGFALLGLLGPFVALTIRRVYYGRTPA
jgi:hypothetical protein